jgi:hypothetical protein
VKREGFDRKRVNPQLREFFTREPESEPKRAKVTTASAADKTRKQPRGCHKYSYRAAQLDSLDEHVRYKHLNEPMPHACDSGSRPPERGCGRRFVDFFFFFFFWFATGSFLFCPVRVAMTFCPFLPSARPRKVRGFVWACFGVRLHGLRMG